jgi:hypothetical protein
MRVGYLGFTHSNGPKSLRRKAWCAERRPPGEGGKAAKPYLSLRLLPGQATAFNMLTLRRDMRTHADDPAKGWLLSTLCLVVFSVFAAQCAPVPSGVFTCEGVQVLSDELTVPEAEAYCHYAVRERKKVEGFWGATWSEPIRIHVSSSYRISKALVPGYLGNRGFMEMPLRGVRENTGALLHEIVHIYAPNNNRFLAEGLAVYLHTKLAGNPAFPNFEDTLRRLAVRGLSGVESLDALNSVRTPRPLATVMEEKAAYILAGSFVGFVIERYGLALFRSLYETENYEKVYGKPLGTLENEWRLSLREN